MHAAAIVVVVVVVAVMYVFKTQHVCCYFAMIRTLVITTKNIITHKQPVHMQEIMAWYLRIRTRLQATRPGVPPHRCYTFRGPQWLMVVQMNDAHELYMTCDPLTTLEAATELAARLLSWAKSQLPVLFSPAS